MSDDQRPADSYDVAILGGGLAGLTLGLQLKQERPETSIFIAEKRDGPRAGGRLQGGRVDPGDLLPLLRRGPRPQGPPRERADPQVRPAVLVPRRRQQRPRAARRARPAQASAGPELPARPRPLRELPRRQVRRGRRRPLPRPLHPGRRDRRRPHEVTSTTREGDTVDHQGALGGRRERPRVHAQEEARPARGQRPRVQLVLVQARRRPRPRGLGRSRRRGVLRAHGGARPPHAQHEPHLRRGLLGVADPARHRATSRSGSSPTRASIPGSRSTRSRARSSGSRSTSRSSADSLEGRLDQIEDFLKVEHFSHGTKQVDDGGQRWSPGRRGGPVPRPVLLAGLGLHRDGERRSRPTWSRASWTARTSRSAPRRTTTST